MTDQELSFGSVEIEKESSVSPFSEQKSSKTVESDISEEEKMEEKTSSSDICDEDTKNACPRNEAVSPMSKSSGEASSRENLRDSSGSENQTFSGLENSKKIGSLLSESLGSSRSRPNTFSNSNQNASFPFLHPSQMHTLAALMKSNNSYWDFSSNSKLLRNGFRSDQIPPNPFYPYFPSNFHGQMENVPVPYLLNAAQYFPNLNCPLNSFSYGGVTLPGAPLPKNIIPGSELNGKTVPQPIWGKNRFAKSLDRTSAFSAFPNFFPSPLPSNSHRNQGLHSSRYSPYSIPPHFQPYSPTQHTFSINQKKEAEKSETCRKQKLPGCRSTSPQKESNQDQSKQPSFKSISNSQLKNMENMVSGLEQSGI